MVLKKRIKVKPREISDEQAYNHNAALCPICGTDVIEEQNERRRLSWTESWVSYVVTRKNVTFCKCPNCDCSWSVKRFKASEESND